MFTVQCKTVELGQSKTILRLMGPCNRKEDEIHEIFYQGALRQFYRGLLLTHALRNVTHDISHATHYTKMRLLSIVSQFQVPSSNGLGEMVSYDM